MPPKPRARAIMVLGTGSHVGKSLIVAALCRIFARRGVRVAPFKSQNMSLNSAATPEGLEIGRAQALQAEAAGIPASVHMNPILLKPSGNMTSQIIVRGRIFGQLSAADYHRRRVPELLPLITESYEHLAATHDLVILEGAGSPAEINLKQHDIVNMRMAALSGASCLLVGDIDRGGVFASLLGTVLLLDPEEQQSIKGFVVNKFRGDVNLLNPGLRMMEDRILKPCLGVIPHYPNLDLDEEDSLGLGEISSIPWEKSTDPGRPLQCAVVGLPSLSNFTDFDSLRAEPSVDLRLVRSPQALAGADVILLPGSKQTADDLRWLRAQNLDQVIQLHAQTGLVAGICGGMQMLGRRILDPHSIESTDEVEALNLLPFATVMHPAKTTVLAQGLLTQGDLFHAGTPQTEVSGYEIHIGQTVYDPGARPFAHLAASPEAYPDGCISATTRIFGTYLHGVFDDDRFRHLFLRQARAFHNLTPPTTLNDWKQHREQSLNSFADHVEQSLDMQTLYTWAGLEDKS